MDGRERNKDEAVWAQLFSLVISLLLDCLERHLPDLEERTLRLHGPVDQARCRYCAWNEPLVPDWLQEPDFPDCSRCRETSMNRERRGKRALRVNRLRPNIVLYGEEHPAGDEIEEVTAQHLKTGPEVIFVVGKALKVPGAKSLAREFGRALKPAGDWLCGSTGTYHRLN